MNGKKILVIDDDADLVASIRVILESKGYKVVSAANKDEGLAKIKELMPDLIIMDVMLEKMSDGFDISRKLKSDEKYKKIPLLMLTAIGDTTGFKFSDVAGDKAWLPVDDYAEKPLKPEELISRVERLISPKNTAGEAGF
ncbi:MAG: response regulator [Candidatus Omnitrophota bacterium]|nr:response regulator [Candidatus Omnitrophota bacterium]